MQQKAFRNAISLQLFPSSTNRWVLVCQTSTNSEQTKSPNFSRMHKPALPIRKELGKASAKTAMCNTMFEQDHYLPIVDFLILDAGMKGASDLSRAWHVEAQSRIWHHFIWPCLPLLFFTITRIFRTDGKIRTFSFCNSRSFPSFECFGIQQLKLNFCRKNQVANTLITISSLTKTPFRSCPSLLM